MKINVWCKDFRLANGYKFFLIIAIVALSLIIGFGSAMAVTSVDGEEGKVASEQQAQGDNCETDEQLIDNTGTEDQTTDESNIPEDSQVDNEANNAQNTNDANNAQITNNNANTKNEYVNSDCLCFTAQQVNSTVKYTSDKYPAINELWKSTDGSSWEQWGKGSDITLNNEGDKVYVKGDNPTGLSTERLYTRFFMTGKISASGNIMSLIDNGQCSYTNVPSCCFYNLFKDCTSLTSAPSLPATSLTYNCYSYMFENCTSLTAAPSLPAKTLGTASYLGLFKGCTSLTSAPDLPATTLKDNCYTRMFQGCSSIVVPPRLPAKTVKIYCYAYMFQGCSSIVYPPKLPATALVNSCYDSMFQNCTSLLAPAILNHVTSLDIGCCSWMYQGCTSLKMHEKEKVSFDEVLWKVPANSADYWSTDMFYGIGSEFPASPNVKTDYYCLGPVATNSSGQDFYNLQQAIDESPTKTTLTINRDVQECIKIYDDDSLTIDMQGHVIKGDGSDSTIVSKGSLTLVDNNTSKPYNYFYTTNTGLWAFDPLPTDEQKENAILPEEVTFDTTEGTYVKVAGGAITGGLSQQDCDGGGLDVFGGTATLQKVSFVGNSSQRYGGGIDVFIGASATMSSGYVCGNYAIKQGGGVSVNTSTYKDEPGWLEINDCIICSNNSGDIGGGICNFGHLKLSNSKVLYNSANGDGGAIYSGWYKSGTVETEKFPNSGYTYASSCTISYNKAGNVGGAISTNMYGKINLDRSTITYNKAKEYAGGIEYWTNLNKLTITSYAKILYNTTDNCGYSDVLKEDNISLGCEDPSKPVIPTLIAAEIGQNSIIGVNVKADLPQPDKGKPVVFTDEKEYYAYNRFKSDNDLYYIDESGDNQPVPTQAMLTYEKPLYYCDISDPQSYTYDGTAKNPEITVTDDGKEMTEGTDYTLEYKNNVNAGTASVVLKGIGDNYRGTMTKTFTISPRDMAVTPKSGQSSVYSGSVPTDITYDYDSSVLVGPQKPVFDGCLGFVDDSKDAGNHEISKNTLKFLDNSSTGFIATNYSINVVTGVNYEITKAQLNITDSSAADKSYDGTTNATVTPGTLSGIVGTEIVSVTASGTFESKDASESAINVTASYTLSGEESVTKNYIAPSNDTLSAKINKAQLTISGSSAANKPYDGTMNATVTPGSLSGVAESEKESVGVNATGTFASKDASESTINVTVSYTLSGEESVTKNYIAPGNDTLQAMINKAQLTISGSSADNKPYDGSTSATVTPGNLSGIIGTEAVGVTATGTFTSKDAAEQINVTAHYALSGDELVTKNYAAPVDETLQATISKAQLTISGSKASDKIYDSTTAATVTPGNLSGIIGTEAVGVTATGTFESKDAADQKNVTAHYALSGAESVTKNYAAPVDETLKATISKAQLTISGSSAADKIYDSTTAATVTPGNLSGIIGTEAVGVTATGTFESKDVSTEQINVTARYTLSGDESITKNYIAPGNDTLQAKINKRDLSLTSESSSKVYDGTPLKTGNPIAGGSGFAGEEGDKVSYNMVERTEVGITTNTFTVNWNEVVLASNYDTTYSFGDIEVTSPESADVKIDTSALETIKASYQATNPSDKISVDLVVSEDAVKPADVEKIQAKVGSKKLSNVDASLLVKVNDIVQEDAGSTNNTLIPVKYKFDFEGKQDFELYRVHADVLAQLTDTPNEYGETVEFSEDTGTVIVNAKKYSCYSVAYNEVVTSSPQPTPASGDGSAANGSSSSTNSATSDNALPLVVAAALTLILGACATVIVRRRFS